MRLFSCICLLFRDSSLFPLSAFHVAVAWRECAAKTKSSESQRKLNKKDRKNKKDKNRKGTKAEREGITFHSLFLPFFPPCLSPFGLDI